MKEPEKRSLNYPLRRREVVQELLKSREGLLVVAGLGAPAWDTTASGDHPLTFPLWGGMGGAVSIGLGLALAQPDQRVLVITGDGEMLMGLGSLSTVGLQQPENLAVVVLDNEHFGETGMQTTHTAASVNLAEIARALGFLPPGASENPPKSALHEKSSFMQKALYFAGSRYGQRLYRWCSLPKKEKSFKSDSEMR